MSTELEKVKKHIPSLQELVEETPETLKENALAVILNQEPPKQWISYHPIVKIKQLIDGEVRDMPLPYIPAGRLEYLLTRIYTKWWLEVKNVLCIANSAVVIVRLYVINPITGETEWNDGVGAAPMQTEKGSGAMDWNMIKSAAVQIAAPAAETYAFKDAAEKFGKIFGKDLARKEAIDYDSILRQVSIQKYNFIESLILNCTLQPEELRAINMELENGISEFRADEIIKRLELNQKDRITGGGMYNQTDIIEKQKDNYQPK